MGQRHDEKRIFEIVEGPDGQRYEQHPITVFGSAVVRPGQSSAKIDFASGPSGRDLVRCHEQEVVETLMMGNLLDRLAAMFGIATGTAWCLLAAPRGRVGLDTDSKPGDFDIIIGASRDGIVRFDRLFEVECKRHVVGASGDLREADGTGTTQAQGAVNAGFDAVALLSIFVGEDRELPEGYASSWRTSRNADHGTAMKRLLGKLRANEGRLGVEPAFGSAILGVGQLTGTDPSYAGAWTFAITDDPPFRPWSDSRTARTNRDTIERSLQKVFGTRRPFHPWFKFCRKCPALFAAADSRVPRCEGCDSRG